jgi:hypothetical protein
MSWYRPIEQVWVVPRDDRRRGTKLEQREYALLAAFRFALRSFLHFSESAAEGSGLTAQHYQAMLVLRGCPEDRRVTINDLAQQLLIRHNRCTARSCGASGRSCDSWSSRSRARPRYHPAERRRAPSKVGATPARVAGSSFCVPEAPPGDHALPIGAVRIPPAARS